MDRNPDTITKEGLKSEQNYLGKEKEENITKKDGYGEPLKNSPEAEEKKIPRERQVGEVWRGKNMKKEKACQMRRNLK